MPRVDARAWLAALLLAAAPHFASAADAVPAAEDPALEARMLAVAAELRCLVCQNQTIADSHSDLAADLRREVRDQIRKGKSDDEVRRYMVDRYGDFVLYRPPFKAITALLWVGPALLLSGALLVLVWTLRRRNRLDPARFDPDTEEDAAGGAR